MPTRHSIFDITVILDALITTYLKTSTCGKLELETGREPPDGRRKTHKTLISSYLALSLSLSLSLLFLYIPKSVLEYCRKTTTIQN